MQQRGAATRYNTLLASAVALHTASSMAIGVTGAPDSHIPPKTGTLAAAPAAWL